MRLSRFTLQGLSKRPVRSVCFLLLAMHAVLLAWCAWHDSPTTDEVAHLPAGISHWRFGRFELFRVNPPLVRMVAALPVIAAGAKTDWRDFTEDPRIRADSRVGRRFMAANGPEVWRLFALARTACIPFLLLGGYLCFRWASELYGKTAGLLAMTLWCFSPNIIAHGHLITTDAAATALGLAAHYAFWRWLRCPSWRQAMLVGVALGLAQLTKTSWIVLFLLWPVLAMGWNIASLGHGRSPSSRRQIVQLGAIFALALYVINLGYGFEGTLRPLGNFCFVSTALGGDQSCRHTHHDRGPMYNSGTQFSSCGNRFSSTPLRRLPVPLPANYVQGIDVQKAFFERRLWSYLGGEWRKGGWWYFYLYALAIKVPLGTWLLVLLAVVARFYLRHRPIAPRDEIILLAPLLTVLAFVSLQTGFTRHLRYVLPVFPYFFIFASSLAAPWIRRNSRIVVVTLLALCWSIGSSLWIYPHSMSYFNELVGGPMRGHNHLGSSNVDWGQDLLHLKHWLRQHPEARPVGMCYVHPNLNPEYLGIEFTALPPSDGWAGAPDMPPEIDRLGPCPGWYAVSVRQLHARQGKYAYFLGFRPVDRIGYSTYIYHLDEQQVNDYRRNHGLTEFLPQGHDASED